MVRFSSSAPLVTVFRDVQVFDAEPGEIRDRDAGGIECDRRFAERRRFRPRGPPGRAHAAIHRASHTDGGESTSSSEARRRIVRVEFLLAGGIRRRRRRCACRVGCRRRTAEGARDAVAVTMRRAARATSAGESASRIRRPGARSADRARHSSARSGIAAPDADFAEVEDFGMHSRLQARLDAGAENAE